MKALFFLIIVISTQAWAISGQEFCESYVSLSKPKTLKKHPFKDTLTVLYDPRNIIQVEELESDHIIDSNKEEITTTSGNKVIFIHLPNPSADKITLQKKQKKISQLKLFKLLKKNNGGPDGPSFMSIGWKPLASFLEIHPTFLFKPKPPILF